MSGHGTIVLHIFRWTTIFCSVYLSLPFLYSFEFTGKYIAEFSQLHALKKLFFLIVCRICRKNCFTGSITAHEITALLTHQINPNLCISLYQPTLITWLTHCDREMASQDRFDFGQYLLINDGSRFFIKACMRSLNLYWRTLDRYKTFL